MCIRDSHRADKILHKKIVKFLLLRGRRKRRGLSGAPAGGKGKRHGGGQHSGSRLFQMFHKMSLLKMLIKGAQPAPAGKTHCGLRCFHSNSRGDKSHSFSDGFRQKVGGKLPCLFKSILLPVAHCPKNRLSLIHILFRAEIRRQRHRHSAHLRRAERPAQPADGH